MHKIVGIDPGLAATGIGIIQFSGRKVARYAYGTIRTEKEDAIGDRLERVFSGVLRVLNDESPDQMVVEDIFSLGKYPRSGITLGKVSGVILLAGAKVKVKVSEIQVREAKQVLTGNGNADKKQLEASVRHFLNIADPIRPYHASDALALAIIGMHRFFERMTSAKGCTLMPSSGLRI